MYLILQIAAGVFLGFIFLFFFLLLMNGGRRAAGEILLDIFSHIPNAILRLIKLMLLMVLAWVPIILTWNIIPDGTVYRVIFMIPASIYLLSIYFYGDKLIIKKSTKSK